MKFLKLLFTQTGNFPRWIIFLFDLGICAASFILAVVLRYSLRLDDRTVTAILHVLPIILVVKAASMIYFKLFSGIIRHTSVQDGLKILYTSVLSSFIILAVDVLNRLIFHFSAWYIPMSILILDFIVCTFFLGSFRIFIKLLYLRVTYAVSGDATTYAVFGAGEAGIITKRKLEQHRGHSNKVVAFFDDNHKKVHKSLEGVEILDFDRDIEDLLKKTDIDNLIISAQNISKSRKQEIIERCLASNINVLSVPPVEKWINGELSFNQIKNVKIDDIIERDTIELDINVVGQQLNGKVVLVTGAAGSIGSEIVRQLLRFKLKKLVVLDSSEVNLYQLDNQLSEKFPKEYNKVIDVLVGDIRDRSRMKMVFEKYQPDVVYHAAAYKHVPLMEDNPTEAIRTNVFGTKNIADFSVEYNVSKFVMVSTDKAVNPTNVMGASKRVAEIYVQSLSTELKRTQRAETRFITTRFGNVLGSSGSVIPRFRKQIEEGGPITVTHPDITRYFMTIPEACQLVLEAGYMGNGGEIFVFDMGKAVKIIDLAKKMIKLSGLSLGKDIQIVFTGLRPGEKISEELLNDQENVLPTHHPKIMIGKVRSYNFAEVSQKFEELSVLIETQNNLAIVGKIKEIVPEFISKNSPYEQLDKTAELSHVTVDSVLNK